MSFPPLHKLMLTSTKVHLANLVEFIPYLPKLRKLHLGAISSFSGLDLWRLTRVLEAHCPDVEDINLVGNSRIGSGLSTSRFLEDFIRKVGRNCKVFISSFINRSIMRIKKRLNLASTPVTSGALTGLLHGPKLKGFRGEASAEGPVLDHPPLLQVLNLNRTKVDDDATEYISACAELEVLELESTRVTEEGLFQIIDKCQYLEVLNLSGCRGVKVIDRRRFFEVWDDARAD